MNTYSFESSLAFGPYDDLIEAFESLNLPKRQIGTSLYGAPIFAYRIGKSGPNGMITAGAHAEEVAGVATALSLATVQPEGVSAWVVPCRDPLGWDGFRRMFTRAAGTRIKIGSHADVITALKKHGDPLVIGDVAVGCVDEVAFFSVSENHPGMADPAEFAYKYLAEHPDLTEMLAGKRIYVHGSPLLTEGRDIYDWGGGPTVYINDEGRIGNFNRFFADDTPPAEVASLRDLADEVRPKWTIDLHEGFGAGYFLFLSNISIQSKIGVRAAEAMVEAVAERNFPLMSRAELAGYMEIDEDALLEVAEGVYAGNPKRHVVVDAFCPYLSTFGTLCYTTEMGMENSLAVRNEMMEVSARACLAVLRDMEK